MKLENITIIFYSIMYYHPLLHYTTILDIINKSDETMIFRPEEMIGIIDLRWLGYYKIKQGDTTTGT